MRLLEDDGGRAAAGFRGHTGDCVVRSIAIATGLPYQAVYDGINEAAKGERIGKRKRGKSTARSGVYKATYHKYLEALGWHWVPTMFIGSGCKVHLTDGELPMGRLIVSVSRHMTAVIDGVIHDTWDPQRPPEVIWSADGVRSVTGGRCVYGYFVRKGQ